MEASIVLELIAFGLLLTAAAALISGKSVYDEIMKNKIPVGSKIIDLKASKTGVVTLNRGILIGVKWHNGEEQVISIRFIRDEKIGRANRYQIY